MTPAPCLQPISLRLCVVGHTHAGTWMVVLAALISSTLINCIFPFFTYVTSSGMLGEFLPQVRGVKAAAADGAFRPVVCLPWYPCT